MTVKDVYPGDLIRHVDTRQVVTVERVDNYYGTFTIRKSNGTFKTLTINANGNMSYVKLKKEEIADYYLNKEMSGETDSWRESD